MCHSRLAGPLWIIPSWNAWRIQMPRLWHASHAWGPAVHEAGRVGMEIGRGTVLSGGSRCCSGGVNRGVSNAATPSIHTPAWFREQVRRGTKGSVQKSEIRRGFNTDFYYQHQVTARLWDREDVFTTLHKHCTVSPLEPQPKNGRASLDASL